MRVLFYFNFTYILSLTGQIRDRILNSCYYILQRLYLKREKTVTNFFIAPQKMKLPILNEKIIFKLYPYI